MASPGLPGRSAVDADVPRLQPGRHAVGARQVLREQVGGQPVVGVVRDRDRLLLIVERDHCGHRAEQLGLGNLGVVTDLRDQRRRDKEAVGEDAADMVAADNGVAVATSAIDDAEDPVARGLVDDRTHRGRGVERIALPGTPARRIAAQ